MHARHGFRSHEGNPQDSDDEMNRPGAPTAPEAGSAVAGPRAAPAGSAPPPGLLCVANFPANTGYAWGFIEGLYAGLAERVAAAGGRTYVAYPAMATPPLTLQGSAARPVQLDVRTASARCMRATIAFVRRLNIRVLYLADRPAWSPAYALLRAAGVRRIVVHDHTSGERTRPTGWKRTLKRWSRRIRPMLADDVVAVSDFVLRRQLDVELVPRQRAHRIHNSLELPAPDPQAAARLRELLGLERDVPVVACASRATAEKGVHHLLRAFDTLEDRAGAAPVLLYMGDGPALPELQALRASLPSRDRIVLAGHRPDAAALLGGADVCVVPSVWQEAFGLAALEPMARGVAVIATRAGGLPEVVEDGVTGVLVAPGSEAELAAALRRLLSDAAERRRLGESGARRARERFSRAAQLDALYPLIMPPVPARPEQSRRWSADAEPVV